MTDRVLHTVLGAQRCSGGVGCRPIPRPPRASVPSSVRGGADRPYPTARQVAVRSVFVHITVPRGGLLL